ncbi:hypothetical protein [Haladaptatus caseinilyticus]|uniref:hypothetical protein n=1 Tax=Haladaptatus caseinilyticus TaxID=2993314 RepID=UPI00224B3F13|nr:hypothetical protein [Haladaptatus caseinilyticus]
MGTQDDSTERPATRNTFDRRLTTMGRRRFISTLLGAGFGSMAGLLTPEDVEVLGRSDIPLVYAQGKNSEPRTTMVPADWFDDLRSAIDAHRRLDVHSTPGVVGSAVVPGEFGGRNATLAVDVTGSEASGVVPERVGDVAVEVNRVESVSSNMARTEQVASFEGKRIPGGVKCANRVAAGTLAPAMYAGDTPFFVTSNHVYGGDEGRFTGEPFFAVGADGPRKIGEVRRGYQLDDFVRIDPVDGFRPVSEILGTSQLPVVGQLTREGLAELKARGAKLEKFAPNSGHTFGSIQAIDGMTCAYGKVCKRGQLKWGSQSDFTDGDSGSVSYHPDLENPDSGLLVGGFNNARTWWPGEDYIWGTAAYRITNEYGFTFSPPTADAR